MPMTAYTMAMGNPTGIPVGLAKAMPRRSGKRPLRQSARKIYKPSDGKGNALPFFVSSCRARGQPLPGALEPNV